MASNSIPQPQGLSVQCQLSLFDQFQQIVNLPLRVFM
jgi:hypothetical protein